jgi:hypothetical protein
MSYFAQSQKQYNINLLRQQTVVICTPTMIKKNELFDTITKLQNEQLKLQLVNTKLIRQLIKNSKFSFLSSLFIGQVAIITTSKLIDLSKLGSIVQQVADKLVFIVAISNNRIITGNRLNFIMTQTNVYYLFFMYFTYLSSFFVKR